MAIVLENRQRYRAFQATMHHNVVCQAAGQCFCEHVEAKGAGGAPELVLKREERSFWIGPRGPAAPSFSEPLPEEVLLLPQIKAARRAGLIRVAGEDEISVEIVKAKS